MKAISPEDLEDISSNFADAFAAIESAIILIVKALAEKRYHIPRYSRQWMEMRCYLPYAVHPTELPNTQILVNRHYKPVGSNQPTKNWVNYEAQRATCMYISPGLNLPL
jgi:hypothetical protein